MSVYVRREKKYPSCKTWVAIAMVLPMACASIAGEPSEPKGTNPGFRVSESLLETEAFTAAVYERLGQITKCLSAQENIDAKTLEGLVVEQFRSTPLRPAQSLKESFRAGNFRVMRATQPPAVDREPLPYRGSGGLAKALDELRRPYHPRDSMRPDFKVYRVEEQDGRVLTEVLYHAVGRGPAGLVEQTAKWRCGWVVPTGQQIRLAGIEVRDYEEVASGSEAALFGDCTKAVMGEASELTSQLRYGAPYWEERIQARIQVDNAAHHGLAVGDVDGDGLEDLYICQPNGLPNKLLLRKEDGTVRDVSAKAGVDWLDGTSVARLVDLDNDGDQDLLLVFVRRLLVMSNNGSGTFSVRNSLEVATDVRGIAVADYDNDGDLDLYVGTYLELDRKELFRNLDSEAGLRMLAEALPRPFNDANNGPRNHLLRNDGAFQFSDVTDQVGLNVNNSRFTLASSWEDYDNDGDQDLYVANDFGRNNLYRNDGGRFVDVAADLGVENRAASMSVMWGDYNNDGWMDIYVSNMFSTAGNRITYHPEFRRNKDQETLSSFRRFAAGNTLFQNAGGTSFRDLTLPAAVDFGRWAWGSRFVDINNDSHEDIFVLNGMFTNEDTKDL